MTCEAALKTATPYYRALSIFNIRKIYLIVTHFIKCYAYKKIAPILNPKLDFNPKIRMVSDIPFLRYYLGPLEDWKSIAAGDLPTPNRNAPRHQSSLPYAFVALKSYLIKIGPDWCFLQIEFRH